MLIEDIAAEILGSPGDHTELTCRIATALATERRAAQEWKDLLDRAMDQWARVVGLYLSARAVADAAGEVLHERQPGRDSIDRALARQALDEALEEFTALREADEAETEGEAPAITPPGMGATEAIELLALNRIPHLEVCGRPGMVMLPATVLAARLVEIEEQGRTVKA